MSRKSASCYAAGLLTGCALLLGATACTSTATSSTAGSASATATTPTTTPSPITGKPGCDDAIQAFRDASANMASKVQDLPTLQAYVTTLVAKLRTAAANATDPAVQAAVNKLADDFNTLVTAAQTSDGGKIQTLMSSLATDGQALVAACG
jgi:hypothetical protein